ncbi:Endonuclease/exonuclease/phosphatase [Tuber indicum]|nr:Endonuclease/exonuclease/phosphatase [Tuber indicum]
MPVRIPQSLSCFSFAARRWVPVASQPIQRPGVQGSTQGIPPGSHFNIVSWNIDYSSSQPSRRCLGLINHVFKNGFPDILCLQEVRSEVRATLLGDSKIRDDFLTTEAETDMEYKYFTTMTLLSKKLFAYSLGSKEGELPSAAGRNGLCVDLILPYAPDTFLRIINVHLESCEAFSFRVEQLKQLSSALYEPGCRGGLIVGDFNSVTDEDHQPIEENKLKDAWLTLDGDTKPDAPTWSVGRRRDPSYEPKRMDKVAMVGLQAEMMELMHPLCIDVPKPGETSDRIGWSDHSGLRCRFFF